jgi:transcriptional antiterminator RfaH
MPIKKQTSKWFLVYTKAKEEQRAKKNLENQGFSIFLPMIAFAINNRSVSTIVKPMFPRYLFIKLNLEKDNWTLIKSTRGVSHMVVFGQKFAEIPGQVIAHLKSGGDKNDIFKQAIKRQEFEKGDTLTIAKGVFRDKEATFLSKKSKERVRILLRFVNHLITTEIAASDIGQKEIIETFKL